MGNTSFGRDRYTSDKISAFSCQIADGKSFDEAELLASLKTDVENQIKQSGATITSQGCPDPPGFYFDYAQSDIHGRVSISGKRSGTTYYSVEATLKESSGTKSK